MKIVTLVGLVLCARVAAAQMPERGVTIERLACADDPSQSYALYLPAAYSPDRRWGVITAGASERTSDRQFLHCSNSSALRAADPGRDQRPAGRA